MSSLTRHYVQYTTMDIMPGFVLMGIEGVLCEDADRGPFLSRPDPDGLLLYHGLSKMFTIVLSSTWTEESEVKQWLIQNGITTTGSNTSRVLVKDRPSTVAEVRERHLLAIMAAGSHVAWVIDTESEVGAVAFRYGVRPMICPRPVYSSFSLRPDAQDFKRSWADMEAEHELQRSLQGQDLPARNEEIDVTQEFWKEVSRG